MDLDAIYKHFPDEDSCLVFLETLRWGDAKPECPYCLTRKSCPIEREKRHHCNGCGLSFSVTAQTLFHKTRVDLRTWLYAIALVTEPGYRITVRDLAIKAGVANATATYMLHRIKLALLEQNAFIQAILRYIVSQRREAP